MTPRAGGLVYDGLLTLCDRASIWATGGAGCHRRFERSARHRPVDPICRVQHYGAGVLEIGHFENCNGPTPIPATPFGLDSSGNPVACPAGNTEGFGSGTSPTDGDDSFCFPGSEALLIHVNGCTNTNAGFDSLGYQPVWPDGNTALHPEPALVSSPLTGRGDTVQYSRMAFEADIPRIEPGQCRFTGVGCTQLPTTDKGAPVAFYPFFSAFQDGVPSEQGNNGCMWGFGNNLPGATTNFGGNTQYGPLLAQNYLLAGGGGATTVRFNDFRQIISNPCPAGENQQH